MSKNITGLTVFLLLLAVASGLYLSAAVFGRSGGSAQPNLQHAESLGLLQPEPDQDRDGLADRQETYWKADFKNPDTDGDGFKDGEEVLSGHDPAKKGPDDWLNNSKNITERLTRLAAGGILTGDLKPDSPTYDASVQRLADEIADKYRQNNTVIVDKVLLTPDDGPAERRAYVVEMAWMIKGIFGPALDDAQQFVASVEDLTWDDPSPLTDDPKRYIAFTTLSRKLAAATGQRAGAIANIRVPFAFSAYHKNAIKLLRTLQRQYELVATMKEDPLQGMGALQSILSLHTETMPAFIADFAESVSRKLATSETR